MADSRFRIDSAFRALGGLSRLFGRNRVQDGGGEPPAKTRLGGFGLDRFIRPRQPPVDITGARDPQGEPLRPDTQKFFDRIQDLFGKDLTDGLRRVFKLFSMGTTTIKPGSPPPDTILPEKF